MFALMYSWNMRGFSGRTIKRTESLFLSDKLADVESMQDKIPGTFIEEIPGTVQDFIGLNEFLTEEGKRQLEIAEINAKMLKLGYKTALENIKKP